MLATLMRPTDLRTRGDFLWQDCPLTDVASVIKLSLMKSKAVNKSVRQMPGNALCKNGWQQPDAGYTNSRDASRDPMRSLAAQHGDSYTQQ